MKQWEGMDKERLSIIIAYFLICILGDSTYYFIGVTLKGLPPFLLGDFEYTKERKCSVYS